VPSSEALTRTDDHRSRHDFVSCRLQFCLILWEAHPSDAPAFCQLGRLNGADLESKGPVGKNKETVAIIF
jgi:hypothetical protein